MFCFCFLFIYLFFTISVSPVISKYGPTGRIFVEFSRLVKYGSGIWLKKSADLTVRKSTQKKVVNLSTSAVINVCAHKTHDRSYNVIQAAASLRSMPA